MMYRIHIKTAGREVVSDPFDIHKKSYQEAKSVLDDIVDIQSGGGYFTMVVQGIRRGYLHREINDIYWTKN